VARLAAAARVHPDHLSRAFHRAFGLAVAQYVRTRRVIWAAEALETTDQPIAEVALEAGFCDQSHLTRSFRSVLGASPAAFRRRTRREPWTGIPSELAHVLLATPEIEAT
jgi:AraC family transcriptional regulator